MGVLTSLAPLVERSADPAAVRSALERLDESWPEALVERVVASGAGGALVTVLAASRSLTRLLQNDPEAAEVLLDPDQRPVAPDPEAPMDAVVRWKRHELLRLAARDLTGVDSVERTTAGLAALGRDVLAAALDRAREGAEDLRLAVIGMGKLGAGELNYSSDLDVVLVGEGDDRALRALARRLLDLAGGCFRIDTNLRPEGRDGPLVRSLASYQAYWERWAEPWERQALLKAAPVAGDQPLGSAWADAAAEVLWDRPFTVDDLRSLRTLKGRAEGEVAAHGDAEREVKRGPGGIRDVEFPVQLLQLVHGRADRELRVRATLPALGALARGGYVDGEEAERLGHAYRFLRRIEHALQLEDERQTHTLPAERHRRRRIARTLGYTGSPTAGPTEAFDTELAAERRFVRSVHERLWFRPLLASLAGAGTLGPDAAAERLAAFGFVDAERTRQAVTELTRGLTRSSRMMRQLLPLLLDWLSSSPDPDLGLVGLRRLASGEQRSTALAIAFRDSPEVARRLAILLGTSRLVGDLLVANPDLIERLADADRLRTRDRPELVESATRAVRWRTDPHEQRRSLWRWSQRHLVGVVARDVLGEADVDVVGRDLSALAEAALEVALASAEPRVPMAVVAFGRFSGRGLGYPSDLDVAFVHRGAGAGTVEEAERVAGHVIRTVAGTTPAERIWPVDATLRPEGRNGPLSRSLESWGTYLERWARTWERQAYLRVRHAAGDPDLGGALVARIDEAVWSRPFGDGDVREVRRMKARIERERIPPGEDPEFHLKLGKGSLSDVEFTVQLLQLVHGVRGGSLFGVVDELVGRGVLDGGDAAVLVDAYRFCEHTRNRRFLVCGPGDSLPARSDQLATLARSLDRTAVELREEYRRVTRRSRRVVERLFYGAGT